MAQLTSQRTAGTPAASQASSSSAASQAELIAKLQKDFAEMRLSMGGRISELERRFTGCEAIVRIFEDLAAQTDLSKAPPTQQGVRWCVPMCMHVIPLHVLTLWVWALPTHRS